jgi:hypothetical protein
MATDLLILAGMVAETLDRHGLVACGRRENGQTRVDFWTRDGRTFRHELAKESPTITVEEIVATCLVTAGLRTSSGGPHELLS